VAIHFTHRLMALILTGVLVALAVSLWRSATTGSGHKFAAGLVGGLLVVQILLGAITVWSTRNPYAATAHVIVGAILLATVFTVTWWTYRNSFVSPLSASLAA
jgi:cytochrome c oxidase assembly protein subunit 15